MRAIKSFKITTKRVLILMAFTGFGFLDHLNAQNWEPLAHVAKISNTKNVDFLDGKKSKRNFEGVVEIGYAHPFSNKTTFKFTHNRSSGISTRILDSARLFAITARHTPVEEIGEEYVIATVRLAEFAREKDTSHVLYLDVEMRSVGAYRTYGSLENGEKMILEFENRSKIELLMEGDSDPGEVSYTTYNTYYSTYFQLTDEVVYAISKDPLKRVRINWSNGFENYLVSDPNILIEQMNCF